MRLLVRIAVVFVLLGIVAASIAFPKLPIYTIRQDVGVTGRSSPMYWIYSSSGPFGLMLQLEAGFDSRDRAFEYVDQARQRDRAEREGRLESEVIR